MTTEQPAPILDDAVRMQDVDKRNMLRLINELPEQCETALGIGRSFNIEPLSITPNVIFFSGIGDSDIAADIAAAILAEEIDVPIVSNHNGRIPSYINEESVVFIIDYLGKSEIALQSYRDAKQRGATVICITSGGKLGEAASKDGLKPARIPPGQPSRSAIGYLFVPVIAIVEKLGIASNVTEKLSYAIKLLKNVRETLRFENFTLRNSAKQAAEALAGKVPVIYGGPDYRTIIARRWQYQCNANSKIPAMLDSFPTVAQSSICAWEMAAGNNIKPGFVFLRDSLDKTTDVAELMDASKEVLDKFGVTEIEIKGATLAEKLLYGIYFGDYVSYYLALLYEVNPSTAQNVTLVTEKLSEQPKAE